MRLILAAVLSLILVSDVEARIFGRRRSYNNYSYGYVNYGYSFSGKTPQEVAEQKAALLAELGYGFHPNNSNFGGGYMEGWGKGWTAEQAKWSTCNGENCLSARGSAQCWSERAQVWFAINIW